jgi:hypothetical protein
MGGEIESQARLAVHKCEGKLMDQYSDAHTVALKDGGHLPISNARLLNANIYCLERREINIVIRQAENVPSFVRSVHTA